MSWSFTRQERLPGCLDPDFPRGERERRRRERERGKTKERKKTRSKNSEESKSSSWIIYIDFKL